MNGFFHLNVVCFKFILKYIFTLYGINNHDVVIEYTYTIESRLISYIETSPGIIETEIVLKNFVFAVLSMLKIYLV